MATKRKQPNFSSTRKNRGKENTGVEEPAAEKSEDVEEEVDSDQEDEEFMGLMDVSSKVAKLEPRVETLEELLREVQEKLNKLEEKASDNGGAEPGSGLPAMVPITMEDLAKKDDEIKK